MIGRVSALLSPDKTLVMGITRSGQADVYSLKTRSFQYTLGSNDVPLHGLATATFFNWSKLSFSRDDDTSLLVVAGLPGPNPKLSTFIPFTKFDPCKSRNINHIYLKFVDKSVSDLVRIMVSATIW